MHFCAHASLGIGKPGCAQSASGDGAPAPAPRAPGSPFLLSLVLLLLGGGVLPLQAQEASVLEVDALVEIPAGSDVKYEIDPGTGAIRVDRFMSMPMHYPGNYGYLPGTMAGDGDPLDVLVLTRTSLVPGSVILVRPVGILRMLDGGEEDAKIIAVPASDVDPHYDSIHTIDDLPAIEVARIEAFFRVYKDLPAGRKVVELNGFGDWEEAAAAVREALRVPTAYSP